MPPFFLRRGVSGPLSCNARRGEDEPAATNPQPLPLHRGGVWSPPYGKGPIRSGGPLQALQGVQQGIHLGIGVGREVGNAKGARLEGAVA